MRYKIERRHLCWAFFLIVIILQHSFVWLYFDDYGYASLTYAWTGNDMGMNFNISKIFEFLRWHYMEWGGRVLYFFFEIVISRIGGVRLLQFAQAVVIFMITYFMYKCLDISGEQYSKYKNLNAMMMIALYGAFATQTLADGIYWYTASFIYVWPLMFWFMAIYLQEKEEKGIKINVIAILYFIAACSQEQVAVMVIVYTISIFILRNFDVNGFRLKKYKLDGMLYIVSAVIGGLISILAPGNFVRAKDPRYEDFSALTIVQKILNNIPSIIDINIGEYNKLFVLMLALAGILMAVRIKEKKLKTALCLYNITFILYNLMTSFIKVNANADTFIRIMWVAIFVIHVLVQYFIEKKYILLSMFISGCCTQGALLVTPSISVRSHVMFEFVLHILIIENVIQTLVYVKKQIIVYALTGFMCLCSIINFGINFNGYYQNNEINKSNFQQLVNAGEKIKNGGEVASINLYKLNDDSFANVMPYQDGFDFILYWMRNYYEIPQNVRIRYLSKDKNPVQVIEGNWSNDGWLGKSATLYLNNSSEEKINLKASEVNDLQDMILNISVGEKKYVLEVEAGQTNSMEIIVPADEEIIIEASKTFRPGNGDERELSVMMTVDYSN